MIAPGTRDIRGCWFPLARVRSAVPRASGSAIARTRRVYIIRAIRSFWFLCEFVDFQLLE